MLETLNNPIIEWLNEYAPEGIVITDADLVIRGWNRWLQRHSGREAGEMIGVRLFDAFPEIVARGLDVFYRAVLDGRAQVLANRFHEYLMTLPTDFETPHGKMQQTVRIAPLMEAGRVAGTITVIEDVSERVVRENELWRSREEAETANRAKDQLLATLSHDLRTPLSSILGWVRLIRNRPLEAETISGGLKSIERNALVQLQLMDEILDTSRIASGKVELTLQETDLVELIDSSVDALTPMAVSKEVRIAKDLPAQPKMLQVDSKRIQQVLWNLLSNALKFTPRGGIVRVSLAFSSARARLEIADSGMGIRPEHLDQVFEPLWQSKEAGGHGGLGLGLSIAKQLVELHGGSIRAESVGPGQGATFILELPQMSENRAQ